MIPEGTPGRVEQDTPAPLGSRTIQEIIDNMPTPRDEAGIFTLFLALEGKAMEEGRTTPEQASETLRRTFGNPEQ